MKRTPAIYAGGLGAVLALAGCSSGTGSGGAMPGMDNHSTLATSPTAAADHNGTDAMFAQGMIPHHAQAVEMSDIILKQQGIDPRVTALATKIKAAQTPENDRLAPGLERTHPGARRPLDDRNDDRG